MIPPDFSTEGLSLPLEIEIMLTWDCPAKCVFCESKLTEAPSTPTPTLTLAVLERSFQAMRTLGVPTLFLTGGEPFLHPELPQIIGLCDELSIGYLISTSGLMHSSVLQRCLAAGLRHVQFSVHGLAGTHCIVTGTNPAAWHEIINNIKACIAARAAVSIAFVPTRLNIRDLLPLCEFVGQVGVSHFRVLRLMPFRESTLDLLVHPDEIQQARPSLEAICDRYGMLLDTSCSPGSAQQSTPRHALAHPYASTCGAGKKKFAVRPNGDALPCYSLRGDSFLCGNILQDDIETIWQHETMRAFRTLSSEDLNGYCGCCSFKSYCYSCRAIAFNLQGDVRGSDVSCLRNEALWEKLASGSGDVTNDQNTVFQPQLSV